MEKKLTLLFFAVFLTFLNSCEQAGSRETIDRETTDRATQTLSDTISQAGDALSNLTPSRKQIKSMTSNELNNVFAVEYKVIDISAGQEAKQIEETLSMLGRERWDCYHVEPQFDSLRVFCKRQPVSYLRYLLKLW